MDELQELTIKFERDTIEANEQDSVHYVKNTGLFHARAQHTEANGLSR